jgi:hypothetical protein
LYLAFNIHTSDVIINSWQKALDELYVSGEILKIFKRYQSEDLYPKAYAIQLTGQSGVIIPDPHPSKVAAIVF